MLCLVLSYSAVGYSSTLISQQYILNKIYLSRITSKWIVWLTEKKTHKNLCISPGAGIQSSIFRRLYRTTVNYTARISNQSILKEINPEYSLEGLMLKLKLQYFGHLVRRADSLEKTLMLGKTEGRKQGCRSQAVCTIFLSWPCLPWLDPSSMVHPKWDWICIKFVWALATKAVPT